MQHIDYFCPSFIDLCYLGIIVLVLYPLGPNFSCRQLHIYYSNTVTYRGLWSTLTAKWAGPHLEEEKKLNHYPSTTMFDSLHNVFYRYVEIDFVEYETAFWANFCYLANLSHDSLHIHLNIFNLNTFKVSCYFQHGYATLFLMAAQYSVHNVHTILSSSILFLFISFHFCFR